MNENIFMFSSYSFGNLFLFQKELGDLYNMEMTHLTKIILINVFENMFPQNFVSTKKVN